MFAPAANTLATQGHVRTSRIDHCLAHTHYSRSHADTANETANESANESNSRTCGLPLSVGLNITHTSSTIIVSWRLRTVVSLRDYQHSSTDICLEVAAGTLASVSLHQPRTTLTSTLPDLFNMSCLRKPHLQLVLTRPGAAVMTAPLECKALKPATHADLQVLGALRRLSQARTLVLYLPADTDTHMPNHLSMAQLSALCDATTAALVNASRAPAALDLKARYRGKGGRIVSSGETFAYAHHHPGAQEAGSGDGDSDSDGDSDGDGDGFSGGVAKDGQVEQEQGEGEAEAGPPSYTDAVPRKRQRRSTSESDADADADLPWTWRGRKARSGGRRAREASVPSDKVQAQPARNSETDKASAHVLSGNMEQALRDGMVAQIAALTNKLHATIAAATAMDMRLRATIHEAEAVEQRTTSDKQAAVARARARARVRSRSRERSSASASTSAPTNAAALPLAPREPTTTALASGDSAASPSASTASALASTLSPAHTSTRSHASSAAEDLSERLRLYLDRRLRRLQQDMETLFNARLEKRLAESLTEHPTMEQMEHQVLAQVEDLAADFVEGPEMWDAIQEAVDGVEANIRGKMMEAWT